MSGNKTRTFRLHWLHGSTEDVTTHEGTDNEAVADAFRKDGYGGGAVRALDYWEEIL